MFTIRSFCTELESLKPSNSPYWFVYKSRGKKFAKVVNSKFQASNREHKHGVYIVRHKRKNSRVIYIGKAGTIKRCGCFKGQDIPGRLKAPRKKQTANKWFKKQARGGPLRIEYIFLEPRKHSPALVEAFLLQAFLNTYGELPKLNHVL